MTCECGCGQETRIPVRSNPRAGQTAGVPLRFVNGHNKLRGTANPRWNGGRSSDVGGYVRVRAPEHPRADSRGRVYEHRLVVEEMLGRSLARGEVVHHINGDKHDNRRENLEVFASQKEHARHHNLAGVAA